MYRWSVRSGQQLTCRRALLVSTALVALAASACSSSSGRPSHPATGSAPPLRTSATQNPAAADVVTAYLRMRDVQIRMDSDGTLHTADLSKYATGSAAADLKKSVLRNAQLGIRFSGRPRMSPHVTQENLPARSATISDCFDATHWIPVDKKTGVPVPLPKQNLRYPVTATATREATSWLITVIVADRTRSC